MGGYGSGRHLQSPERELTSDYRALDVRRWTREGLLMPGNWFGWQWEIDGEKVASIRISVERQNALRLLYRTRSQGSEWRDMDYKVLLDRTPCNFGGDRTWFLCPAKDCGKRVAKLYGGAVFACRNCHALAYPSQREGASGRAARRCERIRSRLGWGGGIFDPSGPKPKGMHWKTFKRLKSEANCAATQSSLLFLDRIQSMSIRLQALADANSTP